MKKRLLSTLLTLCMALTLLPITAAASTNPFTDVISGAYYHDAVIWAKDTGVTGGTTATTFSPTATCTRGQVVTFLWRAEGQPEPTSANNPFTDVKAGDYYYKPVLWAVEQGITGGTSATAFSPAATCTSGQVVTFLWRANGSPEIDYKGSAYYSQALAWAKSKGLIEGTGTFTASAPSPRSAIVTCLYRNAGSPTVTVEQPVKHDLNLYRVTVTDSTSDGIGGAPFRAKEEGAIIGSIPNGTVVEVLSYNKDGYAKVKRNGYEVYVWAAKLKKVAVPDTVCSAWAVNWFAARDGEYVGVKGEWTGVANDYTATITRGQLANELVSVMVDIYGSWSVKFTLPGNSKELLDNLDFSPGRLVYWGVAPRSYFIGNENKTATYGEAVTYLVKLMEYNQKIVEERAQKDVTFTKAVVDGFGVGGNTASTAGCTMEQILLLCDKTVLWKEAEDLKNGVAYEKAHQAEQTREGHNYIGTDTYVIQSSMGEDGKHSYLTINANGEGELQSGKAQSFKVTYLGTDQRGYSYTIQTMDGKYLAIDGMAVNGSKLITQSAAYRWYIRTGWRGFITSAENPHQALNASGWGTADGTPVISWFWNGGGGTDNDNYKFNFEYAK